MEQSQTDVKKEITPVAEVKEQAVNQDAKQEVEAIPYARFSDKVRENKELQEKLSKYESEAETNRQKELEKKGEYETLLSETRIKYEKAKTKADEWDVYVKSRKQTILSTYSEEEQDILGDLSLEKLEKYHDSKSLKTKVGVDNSRGGSSMSPPKAFHEMSIEEKNDPNVWRSYLQTFKRK